MHYILIFLLVLLLHSCTKNAGTSQSNRGNSDSLIKQELTHFEDNETLSIASWIDSLAESYMKEKTKEKILPDTAITVLFDTIEHNGQQYLVAKFGMDDEMRFTTIRSLYIDIIARKAFEFEALNDTLIE